jgi:hypothetical protein
MKRALCVIEIVSQEGQQGVSFRIEKHWSSRAHLAASQYPEIMRQVWRRYRELQR